MPQLHLPEHHTDADLVLAGQIAASIGSGELFIAWTHADGAGAAPTVSAQLREPVNLAAEVVDMILDCAAEFLRALVWPGGKSRPTAPPASA